MTRISDKIFTPAFRENYSNNKRYARSGWLCKCKMAREEEGHLLSGKCTVYGDLTQNFSNLTDIDSLVQSFNQVLERSLFYDLFIVQTNSEIYSMASYVYHKMT